MASNNSKTAGFVWSDDETEALLQITADYKVQKASEALDWESILTKYADITTLLATHIGNHIKDGCKYF